MLKLRDDGPPFFLTEYIDFCYTDYILYGFVVLGLYNFFLCQLLCAFCFMGLVVHEVVVRGTYDMFYLL